MHIGWGCLTPLTFIPKADMFLAIEQMDLGKFGAAFLANGRNMLSVARPVIFLFTSYGQAQ